MKKLFTILLSFICTALFLIPYSGAATLKLGDLNYDNKIDLIDLYCIKRIVIGLDSSIPVADLDQNQRCDITDIYLIKTILLGLNNPTVFTDTSGMFLESCGKTLIRTDYDYAPSVMYGDGLDIKMWWGGGTGTGDGIYYATKTASGWTTPLLVMTKSSSGWDSRHTCDPSVIKGSFNYSGNNYSYAMYYTGTYDNIGYDSHIGVAFSNDGINWTKNKNNPVINPVGDAASQYGAGMQSAYISPDGIITMMYFDSITNSNYVATSTDAIHFSGNTRLITPNPGEHSGDIAYSISESKWYVLTKVGTDEMIYIYETENSLLTSAWKQTGTVSKLSTMQTKNHNPGWMRYPNGNLYSEFKTGYNYLFYGTGGSSPSTWDIGYSVYTKNWDFNINGNLQGWSGVNITTDGAPFSSDAWTFITDKEDPNICSPSIELSSDSFSTVSVRIQNSNSNTSGRIYFKTSQENYYSEDKSVSFTCTNGGGWYTHNVNMSSNEKWTGTITGIRIDPVSIGTNGVCGIDFIRIIK